MNALIDTGILVDYLQGDARAARALDACRHRSVSALTWLAVMDQCPPALREPTRAYLRSFERLSISEAIADEALQLCADHPGLPQALALTWATAQMNRLVFVTCAPGVAGRGVHRPYDAVASSTRRISRP